LRPAQPPPIPALWSLAPRSGPPHSTHGFRIYGGDAASWLSDLAAQPAALQGLASFLPLPDGVLVVFPPGGERPPRTHARLRPFHRLLASDRRELWIPCDADFFPDLDAETLARALFSAEDQWLLAEPSALSDLPQLPSAAAAGFPDLAPPRGLAVRWFSGASTAMLRPAKLIQLPGAAGFANRPEANRPAPLRTHPMLAIRRTLQHSAEEMLERSREDIATALDRVPDATKNWLARLLDQLILGNRPDGPRRLTPGDPPQRAGPVDKAAQAEWAARADKAAQIDPGAPPRAGHGLGDRLLQLLRAGGDPRLVDGPGAHGAPGGPAAAGEGPADLHGRHWLKAGIYSLMNLFSRRTPPPNASNTAGEPMDAEAVRNFSLRQKLLEWWLKRSPRAREELFGEQRSAVMHLLDEFEKGSIQEALRHALPLAPLHDQKAPRSVGIYDSTQLPENDLNAPLRIDHTTRPAMAWMGGADLLNELRKNYNQAAQQLIRQNRHDKAAYIYAMLLGDFWQAAHVLAQGGRHREAAQIYLEQLGDMRYAAAEFEAAGDLEIAAELYLKLEDFDRAARVYENAGLTDQAHGVYRRQADRLLAQGNDLAAGHVFAYKLHDIDRAIETFEGGLRRASGSIASELAVAGLRCQLEQGRFADAGGLESRVFGGWIDDLANLTSAQALTHFCGELAVLGKDLRAEGPAAALQATWREHVLIAAGRLAKLHQEAGRTAHLQRVLEPLQRMFHDDPACFTDALRVQQSRQQRRRSLGPASGGGARTASVQDITRIAGHAPLSCVTGAWESGALVSGDREGAVWLYDPAQQKLLSRQGLGADTVAVAVEAGGYYLAALDAQQHLRIFQTAQNLTEIVAVAAFSVAGASCMAPQIVRDRLFVGTRYGGILTYRLTDGLQTGEPFTLADHSFRHLHMLSAPNRLVAVTSSGLYAVLSYYDNKLELLEGWNALPANPAGDRRLRRLAGGGGGNVFFQLDEPAAPVLYFNAELREEPRRITAGEGAPFGALGCLGDGTPMACLHGAPYRLSLRPDQPHELIPVDMTGMDPAWLIGHAQTDRFWMIDRSGNARLTQVPRPPRAEEKS
ncbi:MAG: hypothetical protein ACREJ2_09070, partial [Planctomycetota bacterium]